MILCLDRSWSILTWAFSDLQQVKYTIRPWMKTCPSLHEIPNSITADPPKENLSSATYPVDIQSSLGSETPHTSRPSSAATTQSTPPASASALLWLSTSASTSCLDSKQDASERRASRAVLFREKHPSTPRTTSSMGRARGKTVPMPGTSDPATPTPESGRMSRAESVLSWTPGTAGSGKQLSGWFSGLLGR